MTSGLAILYSHPSRPIYSKKSREKMVTSENSEKNPEIVRLYVLLEPLCEI
jgi:P pilus assembly chaperone PapD